MAKEVAVTEETIVYTICGRCNKPLMKPAGTGQEGRYGAFSYCTSCRLNTVICSIWFVSRLTVSLFTDSIIHSHLPVRSLLFQCSVCKHGGHHACYRQFYLTHPMVDLPSTPFLPGFGFGSGSSANGQHLAGHGSHSSAGSGVLRSSASSSDLLLLSGSLTQHDSGRGRTLSREATPRSSGTSTSTSTSTSASLSSTSLRGLEMLLSASPCGGLEDGIVTVSPEAMALLEL